MLEKPSLVAPRSVPVIFPSGQTVDAGEYLRSLADANHAGGDDVAAFLDWVRAPGLRPGSAQPVGLGLYPPPAGGESRYQELDLYQKSLLPALWKRRQH